MSKTGIFYSFSSNKTAKAAEKIIEAFGKELKVEAVDADHLDEKEFLAYTNLILGVPTWFDGELPNYWDEFVPALEDLDLKGKTVAIYGLADQKGYPENFADGVGTMAQLLQERGARMVGSTSIEGYTFESSTAIVDGQFMGLVLDQENQARLSGDRIKKWVSELKKHFK